MMAGSASMVTQGQGMMLPGQSWDEMRSKFRWPKPDVFNIAEACCDRWVRADPDRLALRHVNPDGHIQDYSYGQLGAASQRFANVLAEHGVRRGDRVAVLLPQTPEAVLTHLAAYRLGAIVVPLFTLFGEDGLRFRLGDSRTRVVVTDGQNLAKILTIRQSLPGLEAVFSIDTREAGVYGFWQELEKAHDRRPIVQTGPDDPAFISYTSGTTGPPKGALHGHRVLLGHMPGIELAHEFLGQAGDCLWTPADWAWMGGLTNVLLPGLLLGVPVVAHRMAKFDPEWAMELMRKTGVRNAFFPPTALKMMRQTDVGAVSGLRSVASAGEALGKGLLEWGQEAFGLTVNEFYGQTECNVVLGNCAAVMPARPGSTGRAVPGHEVAVLSPEGNILPAGVSGEIAVRRPDPVMLLEYWNQPDMISEKFSGEWLLTGDEGEMDVDGFFYFRSRTDDVINSSGYRIGPSEIEDCLMGHPEVAMAAAVGVTDPIRSEVVKAFVVTRSGDGSSRLRDELIALVRARISPHVAPRYLEFVSDLPVTATGKIQRRLLRDRKVTNERD